MKLLISRFLLLNLLLFSFSCNNKEQRYILKGHAQGTTFTLIYYANEEKSISEDVSNILSDIDNSLSTYKDNSYISKWNRRESLDTLDVYFKEMYLLSKEVYELTDGYFDPTVQPLSQFYGFETRGDSLPIKIDSILNFVGFDKLKYSQESIKSENVNTKLNYNAIAQGYTVDVIVDKLIKLGIKNFIFELGGEVYCSGTKPNSEFWNVGVDKPKEERDGNFQNQVKLSNIAITTSGNYRKWKENPNGGKKYTHTINPKTGENSASDLLSVTVLHKSCAMADALSTALLSMKYNKAVKFLSINNIPVLMIREKQDRIVSETFNDFGDN